MLISHPPRLEQARSRIFISSILIAFLTGCGADMPADGAANPGNGSIPSLVGTVDLRIGVVQGAEPYMFGRIGGIVRDERGRIIVADGQANEVRVFSSRGEFLFAFGRDGEGPGEFDGACCLAFGPDGLLWVRDGGNARYQSFRMRDTSAAYVAQRRMAHGDINFWASPVFDPAGRLIDIGHSVDRESGQFSLVRFHLDSAFAIVARDTIPAPSPDSIGKYTVEFETDNGVGMRYFWQPYGSRQLIAHSPRGGWAVALSSRYAVEWHRADGTVVRVERPGARGPRLSAEERSAAEERMARRTEPFGMTPAELPFDVPERKSPLRALLFDAAGRLWVQRSVPDGADRRADIYDRSGEKEATVVWPAGVRLRLGWIGKDVALGVGRGELGVQRVVRLRLRESGR